VTTATETVETITEDRYHCAKCGGETVGAFALIDTMLWTEREQQTPHWKWMCADHLRHEVELWSAQDAAQSCGVDYVIRLTAGTGL
jgi:hypothetical protein